MNNSSPGVDGNRRLVEQIFRDANFIQSLGIRLSAFGSGWCEAQLQVASTHFQQHEFVHAGVLMTLVDHTCGGAAASVIPEGRDVITIENKVSFLRPGTGPILKCRAEVLRAGKNIIFTEGVITAERPEGPVLVVKASSTLAVIFGSRQEPSTESTRSLLP